MHYTLDRHIGILFFSSGINFTKTVLYFSIHRMIIILAYVWIARNVPSLLAQRKWNFPIPEQGCRRTLRIICLVCYHFTFSCTYAESCLFVSQSTKAPGVAVARRFPPLTYQSVFRFSNSFTCFFSFWAPSILLYLTPQVQLLRLWLETRLYVHVQLEDFIACQLILVICMIILVLHFYLHK